MKKVILLLLLLPAIVSGQQTTFNLASYNIRYHNPEDGINGWQNRKQMLCDLINYHEIDIIGTQEALSNQLKDISDLTGYMYVGVGRDDGRQAGEHSAIFYNPSKFELLGSGDFWLSETPHKPGLGWDAPSNIRICTWGSFRDVTSGTEFFVFNAHYDHRGTIARIESSKLIMKKIEEIAAGCHVIFTGDLNSIPTSEAVAAIEKTMRDSYKVSRTKPYGPVGTANQFNLQAPLKERIDYIFVSRNIEVLKYGVLTDFSDKRFPSDHLPVVVKIELKDTGINER